jgi:GT2 family glycosyltransferase
VAICILNWNGWRDTIECLESVRKLDYPNYLTIVIDNGSSNDSAERIKAWAEENLGSGHVLADYRRETALHGGEAQTEQALEHAPSPARLVLIRNEENLGFTGGNNVVFRYALSRRKRADYLFALNNDATVKRDTLTHLVSTAIESGAGVVGAVVISKDRPDDRFEGPFSFLHNFFMPPLSSQRPKPDKRQRFWTSDFVSGAAMLIRGDVLEELHRSTGEFLSSKLFMFWDEQAFCLQARRAGHSCVFSRDATVDHEWGKSSDRRIRGYYTERNKILLVNMALPLKWKLAFHMVYLPIGLARIVWATLRGKTVLAKTLLLSMCDGYRGIGGKWKYHDQRAGQMGCPTDASVTRALLK